MGLQILKTKILSVTHSPRPQQPVVTESGNDSSPTVRGLAPFPGESYTSSHIIFHSASFHQVSPLLPCPFISKQEASLGSGSPLIYGHCCLQEEPKPQGTEEPGLLGGPTTGWLADFPSELWAALSVPCTHLSTSHPRPWAVQGGSHISQGPWEKQLIQFCLQPPSAKGSVGCLTLELGQGLETEPSCSPSPVPSEVQALCVFHTGKTKQVHVQGPLYFSVLHAHTCLSLARDPHHAPDPHHMQVCHLNLHTQPFLTRGSALGLMLCWCCHEFLILELMLYKWNLMGQWSTWLWGEETP